jgi:CRP-like cAMP-binding protein
VLKANEQTIGQPTIIGNKNKLLTITELEYLEYVCHQKEFARPVEMMDSVLRDLKFFKRFEKEIRTVIIENAEFYKLEAGTTIFRQGDVGDFMYIILMGHVSVRINKG